MGPRAGSNDAPKFLPSKHLRFEDEPKVLTMRDLGFSDDVGISPIAVTQPFKLFSHKAINVMRTEIMQPEVLKNHAFSSNLAASQLRGYARSHAPFTFAAWNHPDTVAIVSKLAGIDLVPYSDYEIAHINLSIKTDEQVKAELVAIQEEKQKMHDSADFEKISQDELPVVGWHQDSYPFVCILMMSDCTDMVGGETALRTATGDVVRVRSPEQGCAIILQGRHIVHQALRTLGTKERITAVTSYRARSSFVKDDSVLRTVRPISDLSELYYDFAEYRLAIMEDRVRKARKEMRANREKGKKFDTTGHKEFLHKSTAFMSHTNEEIVEEDMVQNAYIDTVEIPQVGTPCA